jgi:hypothetical protein
VRSPATSGRTDRVRAERKTLDVDGRPDPRRSHRPVRTPGCLTGRSRPRGWVAARAVRPCLTRPLAGRDQRARETPSTRGGHFLPTPKGDKP